MITRRRFLEASMAAGALAATGTGLASTQGGTKRLLVLGGTGFLGPHTVRAALAEGYEVTLFNRGRTNTHLFPELEKLRGDRDGDLEALKGREWDAVLDTSGYVPRIVGQSVDLLADAVPHYVFVSTISVYASLAAPGIDEDDPVGRLDDPTVEEITGETYGPLKALCENRVRDRYGDGCTIVRPGLIVGPGDRTDRFTYWPVRVARGGDVLAPGTPDGPVQFIDVRDLGEWLVHCLGARVAGTYNATNPPGSVTMGGLLETCRRVAGSDARFHWADAGFLAEQGIQPWSDMPAWAPPDSDFGGISQVSVDRATGEGLEFRPVEDTVQATLAWFREQDTERQAALKAGLSPEREAAALEALAART